MKLTKHMHGEIRNLRCVDPEGSAAVFSGTADVFIGELAAGWRENKKICLQEDLLAPGTEDSEEDTLMSSELFTLLSHNQIYSHNEQSVLEKERPDCVKTRSWFSRARETELGAREALCQEPRSSRVKNRAATTWPWTLLSTVSPPREPTPPCQH